MKNHPVVPVKMNKFSFIQGITFCFWSPRAPFCLPKHPSTVQASVLAELAEGPVVFSPSQCLKHGSFGRAAAFQALQTLGPKRQVEPLVSFGLLGIARPGAAPCLGVSSEAASCSLVPRHHNCREGAANCSAWQGFLCKEHQCLVVSSEFFLKKATEITLHKVREILSMQEVLPKISCLSQLFIFKFQTVLLELCMKIVLITAGNGIIKELDPDLLAICWYMGEMKDFYGYMFDCL